MSIERLPPEALYRRCDAAQLGFDTTADLKPLGELFGQPRAAGSVDFGIGIAREGYNLYVMGSPGTGKHTLVRQQLARKVEKRELPGDWAYVNNFREPSKPIALALPAGRGAALREDMRTLVEELRSAIPAVFESDEYRARAGQIEAEFTERHEKAFTELGTEAAKDSIALLRTPAGFSFAPLKDGEVMSPEDFAALRDEERSRIERRIGELQSKLESIIRNVVRWRKEQRERFKELNREMTLYAVGHHVSDLKEKYRDLQRVLEYVDAVQQDVIDNAEDFIKSREAPAGAMGAPAEGPSFRRYQVNLLVDHGGPEHSLIVSEDHPTYQNLVGRVDHIAQFGTLQTDFGLIKAGALHRANGGYLLLDARKLLMQPFAWEGLKRALSTREIRIESLGEMYSLVSTVSLAPEPIPLGVKVIVFGDRLIYYLLHAYDPDFRQLFKVAADFEDHFERTPDNDLLFAQLVATMAGEKKLAPFERGAVARVIEHSARLAGDSLKLSANLEAVSDLLCESDYWARESGRDRVAAADIERAIEAQRKRADRLRERMHEQILRGTVLIDTAGERVGQINGLSVLQLGDYAFAEPTRITATTRLGDGRVIDVQREVELGGAIHSKGVLILSAFLAARFSTNRPHSLAASLVFEQTYGLVEGDSASLAELCALLSSLADVPIRQSLAVTGSVNQLGEAQAIGAVNEKIEGFFDICSARGLDGKQGVLIPASNVEHLMLRPDVIEAVAGGRFHVYPVVHVDQAIEMLTGVPAGEPDAAGAFPPASVNGRVARRMRELSELRRKLAPSGEGARERRKR
ncbi:MAG TPA: ATP-binding protein [Burkholderiales bacterium]|jgi:predicted ATP-dependent protease|nr:ATP-binding protein [Burkholderiales bacterium]